MCYWGVLLNIKVNSFLETPPRATASSAGCACGRVNIYENPSATIEHWTEISRFTTRIQSNNWMILKSTVQNLSGTVYTIFHPSIPSFYRSWKVRGAWLSSGQCQVLRGIWLRAFRNFRRCNIVYFQVICCLQMPFYLQREAPQCFRCLDRCVRHPSETVASRVLWISVSTTGTKSPRSSHQWERESKQSASYTSKELLSLCPLHVH